MKKYGVLIFILVLALVTGIVAWFHLTTREEVASGTVQITVNDEEITVNLSQLAYEPVSGVRVNGKGETIAVEGQGISLKNLLLGQQITSYTKVTVVADDAYSAELTAEEAEADGKAYLLLEEDTLRLVVFGDENSKRSITQVVQIIVE